MPKKSSIIIVEDHPVMREGLASWFAATGRWQVLGKASSLTEARELLAHSQADVLLLDIQLDDGWGLDIIPWLREHNAQTERTRKGKRPTGIIAAYTVFDDFAHASAALSMGVRAYVCKRRNAQELEEALLAALSGAVHIDSSVQAKLQTVTDIISLLTRRETEILGLVKSGLTNKQIAFQLGISSRTVENILSLIYDKTGIRSRLELEKL